MVHDSLTQFHRPYKPNKQRYLRQSIQLTGLGTPMFETCIERVRQAHDLFYRHLPSNSFEPLNLDTFLDSTCLNFATRYFTSRHDDPLGTGLPFGNNVDPYGILKSMVTERYFHGADNKVFYYMAKGTHDERW
jgi:hypothetical protein